MSRPDDFSEHREAPWSAEAEHAVLGAVLLDNLAFERVYDLLNPADFYAAENGAIWRTIVTLQAKGKPADVITVHEAGGHDRATLNAYVDSIPSSANAHRYAAIVRERSIDRQMMREAGAVIELAHRNDMATADKVDKAQSAFAALAQKRHGAHDPVAIGQAATELIEYVQAVAAGEDQAISTGLDNLDHATAGGIRAGEMWVIGARPKMGKTALALALQRNMSVEHGTLYLSQEMPVLQLTMRHAAAVGGMNLQVLRDPDPKDGDMWSRLAAAADDLRKLNMVQDSQGGLTLLDVRRKVMHARRHHGIDVVFVDFLQLMVGDGANRNAELDAISNGLKAMAMEFKVGIVLLSQLNRKADERSGPPVMADLRDSGAIEAAADLIGMLYRDVVRNPTGDNTRHAQLEIVAQRNGPAGTVHLHFVGEHQQFTDWPRNAPLPMRRASKSYSGGGLE
jgi:replicative DNA helicase